MTLGRQRRRAYFMKSGLGSQEVSPERERDIRKRERERERERESLTGGQFTVLLQDYINHHIMALSYSDR
jgi:hypothetical protein